MNTFFLILFLFYFYGGIQGEETTQKTKLKEYCIISRIWNCTLGTVEEDSIPDFVKNYRIYDDYESDFEIQFLYETPVDVYSGDLFVSNIIRWKLDKKFIRDKNINIWIKIDELDSGITVSSKFFKIEAKRGEWTKRALNYSYTEFTLSLERKFEIGKDYRLTVLYRTLLSEKREIIQSSTKLIKIPGLENLEDEFDCSDSHISKTKKLAGRWSTEIKTTLSSMIGQVNITFYAAPRGFCIDRYEVKLFEVIRGHRIPIKTEIIKEKNLIKKGKNYLGFVVFRNLTRGLDYSFQVKAVENRENSSTCLCWVPNSCDCISVSTNPFKIPKIEESTYAKSITTKYSESRNRPQQLPSAEDITSVFTISILIILLVIIVIMFSLIFFCSAYQKSKEKKSKNGTKVLLKIRKNDTVDITPLIKVQKTTSLFILNVDDSKASFISVLVDFLKSHGIRISYPQSDSNEVEQNIFYYVHKSICDADKILLFHSEKSRHLIRGLRSPVPEGIFDGVYSTALNLISLSDPKVIHIGFAEDKIAKEGFAETFLEFPRDVKYLMDSLGIKTDFESLMDSLRIKTDFESLMDPLRIKTDSKSLMDSLKIKTDEKMLEKLKTTFPEPMEEFIVDLPKSTKELNFSLPESPEIETTSDSIKFVSIEDDRNSANPPVVEPKIRISVQSVDSGIHTEEICS